MLYSTLSKWVFWAAILYIAYMFSYATALPKILQQEGMVMSMEKRGFPAWATLILGIFECLCAISLFIPRLRVVALLVLFLISVGAFSSHLATHDPLWKFYRVGSMCVLIPLALYLDPYFQIKLYQ